MVLMTYVVLVRKHDKLARHAASLQDVEHGQTLRDGQAVVKLIVDDLLLCKRISQVTECIHRVLQVPAYQLRRGPVSNVLRGIPLLVAFSVLPEGATKVVLWEEELLCRPLVQGRKDSVVAHQCLELPPKVMALNPVW